MPSRASSWPATIRGARAPPRWNGPCRHRRRSISSKCCRACNEVQARHIKRAARIKLTFPPHQPVCGGTISREVGLILSVLDQNAIELAPRISEAAVADYVALLKPRVMSLVVFTALVGFFLAPGHVHPVLAITSILCIAVGGGASGALNMWYEGDIDAQMSRTANRPIPRGRISAPEALAFGLTLA